MNLWKLKRGQCVEVKLQTHPHVPGVAAAEWAFTHDFNVLLGQLFEEVGQDDLPTTVEVCGEPIEDFVEWVRSQEPEWDRYGPETAQVAVERGLMPEDAYRIETGVNAPLWIDRFDEATWRDLLHAGFERYLDNMAKGIRGEPGTYPVPPLVRVDGVPADGRHRTWTALKMRRKTAPVINVTSSENRAAPVDFAERYMITTARGGRIYGYREMLDLAMRRLRRSPLPGLRQADPRHLRAAAEEILQDEQFMKFRYGMVPTRVADDVEERVWERLRAQ